LLPDAVVRVATVFFVTVPFVSRDRIEDAADLLAGPFLKAHIHLPS
jgi:hypothetical protein